MKKLTEMKVSGTKAKHIELRELSKNSKERVYDRLRLASEIMSDTKYINTEFPDAKSDIAVAEQLEDENFTDICHGLIHLYSLIQMFHHFSKKDWEKENFNLRNLWARYKEDTSTPKLPTERFSYKELYLEADKKFNDEVFAHNQDLNKLQLVEAKIKVLESNQPQAHGQEDLIKSLRQIANSARTEVRELREKNRELAAENLQLKNENTDLKSRLEEVESAVILS